jgi:hypothetical protein
MRKHTLLAAVGVLGAVVLGPPAQAQPESTSEGATAVSTTTPIIWRTSPLATGAILAEHNAGDPAHLVDELLVGVPGEDNGAAANSGFAHLVNATTSGGFDSSAIDPTVRADSLFGATVAAGDFNCDETDEVAISAPGQAVSYNPTTGAPVGPNAGTVLVGGDSASLTIVQGGGGLAGEAEANDWFGSSLAVGDFNGDGCDDLAIGAPAEDIGTTADAGNVTVIPGGPASQSRPLGLLLGQARVLHAGTSTDGLAGVAEAGDVLGAALASGDFNGDGRDDLAIGMPGEDLKRRTHAGAIVVVPGSGAGLDAAASVERGSGTRGLAGAIEAWDMVGGALATGDVSGDGRDDLVIGVHGEDWGRKLDAGAVIVARGSITGLSTAGVVELAQGAGLPGVAEAHDYVGASVAIGNVDGTTGKDDLVVGVPGEDVAGVANAGAIVWAKGSNNGLVAQVELRSGGGSLAGAAEAQDRLGTALAVGDLDGDGIAEVIVSAGGEDIGAAADAGAITFVIGTPDGLVPDSVLNSPDSVEHAQGGLTFGQTPEAGDAFGGTKFPGTPR